MKLDFYNVLTKRFREAIIFTNASRINPFATIDDMKTYFNGITDSTIEELTQRIDNIINQNPQPSEVVDARDSTKVFLDSGLTVPTTLRNTLINYDLGVYVAYVPFDATYTPTECYLALTNAVAGASAAGGGIVKLGRGNWVLSQNFFISSNIEIVLAKGATLSVTNPLAGLFVGSNSGITGSGNNTISGAASQQEPLIKTEPTGSKQYICGVKLTGEGDSVGISIEDTSSCKVEDVEIEGFATGIELVGSTDNRVEKVRILDCPIGIYEDSNSHYNQFYDVAVTGADDTALEIHSNANQLNNIQVSDGALGIVFVGENNVLTNGTFRTNSSSHVVVEEDANNTVINSTYLEGSSSKLIIDDGSEGVYASVVFGSEGSRIISKGEMVLVRSGNTDGEILQVKRDLQDDFPLLVLDSNGELRLGNGEANPTTTISGDADSFYVNGRLNITGTWDKPFYVNSKPVWIDGNGAMRTKTTAGVPSNQFDGVKVAEQ